MPKLSMMLTPSPTLFVPFTENEKALARLVPTVPLHSPQRFSAVAYLAPSAFPDHQPPPSKWKIPEYAFLGRSNSGKSTLLSALLGNAAEAKLTTKTGPRAGKTPGKTKMVQYYGVWAPSVETPDPSNACQYWIDLPGYGFAGTVSKKKREDWDKNTKEFLVSRAMLEDGLVREAGGIRNVFVLCDSRRLPVVTENDNSTLDWLDKNFVPHSIVLTKIDKLSQRERVIAFNDACASVLKRSRRYTFLKPEVYGVSGLTGEGVADLMQFMARGGNQYAEMLEKQWWGDPINDEDLV